MDHPQVLRTLRTGYFEPQRDNSVNCTHCDEEIYDFVLEFEDRHFCDKYCFADWAVETGMVTEVAAY